MAGGGSFISFPALIFAGVPAVAANATSTVALWPGSVASTFAYHRELSGMRTRLLSLSVVSLIGGFMGAMLLLRTGDAAFQQIVPWLILLATGTFAIGPTITARLRSTAQQSHAEMPTRERISWQAYAIQLLISIYGGYFGGGIGIMMLASLAVGGMTDMQAMNALKNGLATVINGVAVLTFIAAGAVHWPETGVMVIGAIAGGFAGVSIARRIPAVLLWRFIILIGCTLTLYFFHRL